MRIEVTYDRDKVAAIVTRIDDLSKGMASRIGFLAGNILLRHVRKTAPKKTGALSRSFELIRSPEGYAVMSALPYAAIRDRGGVIHRRRAPFLVFEINGEIIYTRQVTQRGTDYLRRAQASAEPEIAKAIVAQTLEILK